MFLASFVFVIVITRCWFDAFICLCLRVFISGVYVLVVGCFGSRLRFFDFRGTVIAFAFVSVVLVVCDLS